MKDLYESGFERNTHPIGETSDRMTLGRLKNLLDNLPGLSEELGYFASDLEWIVENQPLLSIRDPWG